MAGDTIDITPSEQAALQLVIARHARIEGSSRFLFDAATPPVAGSPRDLADKAELTDPYVLAGVLLYAAEDHLRTVLLVMEKGPLPSYSLFTLFRTAAEAEVRCRHLLDPAISEKLRLARGLNERLDNLTEQRKAVGNQAHFDERVDHLEKRALCHGIRPKWSVPKRGDVPEVIGFEGETVKSEVELFSLYLRHGSAAVRFLGGHVHSKPWVQFVRSRAQRTADPKVVAIPTDVDVGLLVGIVDSVLTVRDANVGHWLTLAGYPADLWTHATKAPP
ncbi:MAG TPA: hypothetical protein DEV93_14930 [Chloroflexi bacterium]|jgi:hypothetical protein|nr:hypothetical protein [Chloroflexota bacterium]HCG01822.1 hypothetical protein [Chloroflexota bacterium]